MKATEKFSPEIRRDIAVVIKILLPVIFLVCVIAYFHTFVINAIRSNVAINGLIIAAASYGVALILARLFAAQGDFRVIERFGREASQGVYMKQLLEEPWLQKRYVRNYLAHIAQTGGTLSSQLDQNAIESELHALSAEYESKLELPQFLVGFMIAMGLLGTFIGLLETLTGISSMLDGMGTSGANVEQQFMQLIGELRKPLAGMGIAFSASMFGLVTSLMLAIMMINLRRYINRVVACARNVMHELIELNHGATSGGGVTQLTPQDISAMAGEVEEVRGPPSREIAINPDDPRLQELLGDTYDSSRLIAARVDALAAKLEVLMHLFEESTQSTRNLNDLLGFGPRMKEISEKTLDELKSLSFSQIEEQRIFLKLVDVNSNMVRIAEGIADGQRQFHSELALSFKALGERVSSVESSNAGASRHLWEIKENFMKLSVSLGMVESISAGVGGQNLLLESLIKETRNTHKLLMAMHQDMRSS